MKATLVTLSLCALLLMAILSGVGCFASPASSQPAPAGKAPPASNPSPAKPTTLPAPPPDRWDTLTNALIVAGALFVILLILTCNKTYGRTFKREIRTDALQSQLNGMLSFLALLLPLIGALLAYLMTKVPDQVPILLLASAVCVALAALCLFWVLSALLRKLPPDDTIIFRFPVEKRYFQAMGLVYGLVMVSVVYLMVGLWQLTPLIKVAEGIKN